MSAYKSELLNEFKNIRSPRWVTFTYRAKGTGELSRYTILVGANYTNHVKSDLRVLRSLNRNTLTDEQKVIVDQMIKSFTEHITNGVSSGYTLKGYYQHDGKNLKTAEKTNTLYLNGYFLRKTVIEAGVAKPKKWSDKDQFKKKLNLKTARFRQFILDTDKINTIAHDKKKWELEFNF